MRVYGSVVAESSSLDSPPATGGDPAALPARRTYTGAALERRKAWGKEWGKVTSEAASKPRED